MPPEVAWVFSLARSGSSVIAYAAAAGFACPVADEIFGPWDRTGAPYAYPPEQVALVDSFQRAGYTLDQQSIVLAGRVFEAIGRGSPRLVSKYPHLVDPEGMFRDAFPGHPAVMLLRHPLHRLNSMYARGWADAISDRYDLDRYKAFLRQWLVHPGALLFDDLRKDPADFFRRLYAAWGWPATRANVDAAASYARANYHSNSAELDPAPAGNRPVSEGAMALPREAVTAYLGDPTVRVVMEHYGWSIDPASYLP